MPLRSPATTGDKYQRSLKWLVRGRSTLDKLFVFRQSLTLVHSKECIVFLFERLGNSSAMGGFCFLLPWS